MRYVIAMIFALAVAVFAAAQFAAPLTTSIVDGMKFTSPDDVEFFSTLLMAAIAFSGLVVGWLAGWVIGGLFFSSGPTQKPDQPQS